MSGSVEVTCPVMCPVTCPGEDQLPTRYYDDLELLHLPGDRILVRDPLWSPMTWSKTHWWLLVDATPVAFLNTLLNEGDEYPLVLCDIEVRATHQRRGYAREIVAAVEAFEQHTLYTSGQFTPAGAAALSFVPVLPWNTAAVVFEDMHFVSDWDDLLARFPG